MNLIFGRLPFAPVVVFGLPGLLFCALYFGKRGKPEGYLVHALRFYISSGELHAGERGESV